MANFEIVYAEETERRKTLLVKSGWTGLGFSYKEKILSVLRSYLINVVAKEAKDTGGEFSIDALPLGGHCLTFSSYAEPTPSLVLIEDFVDSVEKDKNKGLYVNINVTVLPEETRAIVNSIKNHFPHSESLKTFNKDFVNGVYSYLPSRLGGLSLEHLVYIASHPSDYVLEYNTVNYGFYSEAEIKPAAKPKGILAKGGEKAIVSMLGKLVNKELSIVLTEVYGGKWGYVLGLDYNTRKKKFLPAKALAQAKDRLASVNEQFTIFNEVKRQLEAFCSLIEREGGEAKFKAKLVEKLKIMLPSKAALWMTDEVFGEVAKAYLTNK